MEEETIREGGDCWFEEKANAARKRGSMHLLRKKACPPGDVDSSLPSFPIWRERTRGGADAPESPSAGPVEGKELR